MDITKYSYIALPEMTGRIEEDAAALLSRNGKEKTLGHVRAVAQTCEKIGQSYGLDPEKCSIAGLLHDIAAILRPGDMLEYFSSLGPALDPSEEKHPFLLHQRASAMIAKESFGIFDPDILSAIDCHTTLKAGPCAYDMALFVADKLSWDGEGAPPFYSTVAEALANSLEAASLSYIDYIIENDMLLCPHARLLETREWLSAALKTGKAPPEKSGGGAGLIVRDMGPEDLEGKAFVHWKSWQETYAGIVDPGYLASLSLEKTRGIARKYPKNTLVAAVLEGGAEKIIGFAAYGPCRDPDTENCGEVFAIYVLAEYHGKKIGFSLMRECLRRLSGYSKCAVWVLEKNTRAISFYTRCGFVPDGKRAEITLGAPVMNIRMVLDPGENGPFPQ